MILSQATLDASIGDLVTRVRQTYEFLLEDMSPSMVNAMKDILVEISHVMQECAEFIVKCSETANFCTLITPVFLGGPHLHYRASTRQECGDSRQGRLLQFKARQVDTGPSRPGTCQHPI